MAQNDSEWPISPDSQLFQSFPIEVAWNGQFCPICNFSNLFPPKWLRMTWNGQFRPIHNFSNLFPLKWLRMTPNGQFHPIRNFSNLFPLKWLRMTRNGQFCIAKIKYTLIQGNFYERLLFYMDSCALSPMASLFKTTTCLYNDKNYRAQRVVVNDRFYYKVTVVKAISRLDLLKSRVRKLLNNKAVEIRKI